MKKDYKLISILNPINNFSTFSKYSDSLEKIFKKKSLKSLLYNLNNPTIFSESDDEKLCKKEIERYTSEKEKDTDQKNLLDYNYDDYIKSQKAKFNKNKKIEPWSINKQIPRIPLIQRNLDFFKYNPNYNSIYKNVPTFAYVKSSKKKIKSYDKIDKKHSENHYIESNNEYAKTENNTKYKNKNIRNKVFPLLTNASSKSSQSIINEHRKNKSNNLYDKNNHTFRFSKYAPRKPLELKVNNKVTYLNDFDLLMHMNKTIDFKKMTKRNEKNLINTFTLKNPSMCYYNPNYDCVEKKTKKISFNPNSFRSTIKYKKNKKLKKILMSYDVNTQYNTIDNSKLVKAESITKLLNL